MKQSILRYLSVGLLVSAALSVQAESFQYPEVEEDRAAGFTLTPMIGQFDPDSDRNLDDEFYTGLGIGYRFSDPYMLEFVYGKADATTSTGGNLGDIRQYRLEMLFDLGGTGNWSPYFALGAASTEFGDNAAVVDDEGALSVGFGTRYNFTDRIALRGDLRYLRAVGDTKGADLLYTLGLQFFLGQTKKPAAKPAPAPVASFADLCAQAGGVVDADSCVKKSVVSERINLNVQFKTNSDQVLPEYVAKVKEFADFMSTYPTATASIEGHTDTRGDANYNQSLSQRRVNEVVRLLTSNYDIAENRLSAVGYGETQPIANNDTREGRAQNRRVVASVLVEVEETIQLNVK